MMILTLKERIEKEMVIQKEDRIEMQLWKEIGYRFIGWSDFHKAYLKAKKKVKA